MTEHWYVLSNLVKGSWRRFCDHTRWNASEWWASFETCKMEVDSLYGRTRPMAHWKTNATTINVFLPGCREILKESKEQRTVARTTAAQAKNAACQNAIQKTAGRALHRKDEMRCKCWSRWCIKSSLSTHTKNSSARLGTQVVAFQQKHSNQIVDWIYLTVANPRMFYLLLT